MIFTPTMGLLVVAEAWVLWVALARIRPVDRGAGTLMAAGCGFALVVALLVGAVELGALALLVVDGSVTPPVSWMIPVAFVGLGLPPLAHGLAMGSMVLGLARLALRIRGTDLDDRVRDYAEGPGR